MKPQVRLRIFTNAQNHVRIFTHTSIAPGEPALIYHHARKACAYLPLRLRRFTTQPHFPCADLPIRSFNRAQIYAYGGELSRATGIQQYSNTGSVNLYYCMPVNLYLLL